MNIENKELFWFLVPTFISTYGLGVIAYYMAGLDNFPLMIVSMYISAMTILTHYLLKFKTPILKGINNKLCNE